MQFKDCKKDQTIIMKRPKEKARKGTIIRLRPEDRVVRVRWEDGSEDNFDASIQYMEPLTDKEEELSFFANTGEGNCPCGIPRNSGRCPYH